MWLTFLQSYNGITIIRQPSITTSNALNLYTDASDLGYGGCYGSSWFAGTWPATWAKYSIAVRELYPIMAVIHTFGHKLRNTRILFNCDNQAIVTVINKQSAKDKNIMSLLRVLILSLLHHNIRFKAEYISTHDNVIADSLSRLQATPQLLEYHSLNRDPVALDPDVLPENWRL